MLNATEELSLKTEFTNLKGVNRIDVSIYMFV